MSISGIISAFVQFFFLLTPFFVLSMFISMTSEFTEAQRRKLAHKVALSALSTSLILLLFGRWLFTVFGITLDAFRIGGGLLLMLSAIKLVNGAAGAISPDNVAKPDADIAVVPLAIPVTIGPATTGALLILGAEAKTTAAVLGNMIGLVAALAAVWGILCCAVLLERVLRRRGIVILSKLTGLVLAAIAAEMMFTGIRAFLSFQVK